MSVTSQAHPPAAATFSDYAKHQQLVEGLPFGLVICRAGDIRVANRRALELLGAHTADELTGRELIRFVQPSDQRILQGLLLPDIEGGKANGKAVVRLLRRDGTERVVELTASHLGNGDVSVALSEIDEQTLAAEVLRQSEQQHRALVDDAPDGVLILGMDGEILFANAGACDILGTGTRANTQGRRYNDLCVASDHRELLHQALNRQGFIRNFEYELRRPNGHRRTVLEHAKLIRDSQGTPLFCRSYIRDITEWKQLEEQLFQMQKMESLTRLTGSIGHDFINVLNNMRGFASQLKKHIHEPDRVQKYADTLEKSADRGLELANKLLGYARKRKVQSSHAHTRDVIAEVVEIARESFGSAITVVTTVDPELPAVTMDSGELYQALMNICINAKDAMPNGGTLTISARLCSSPEDEPLLAATKPTSGKYVVISIADTGIGMPDDIKAKIFDPFFTTKGRGKGTGLGLSIVYNTVQHYHGTIGVETEQHKGSTFTMYLPAADALVQTASPSSRGGEHTGKNELILLVDDETMMQELGKELLEEQGYRVLLARDGVEAVEIYRRHAGEIALVILDLLMPRLDGGQAYLELKKINENVRAFFCTGFTPQEIIGSLLQGHSLKALQKPFKPAELLSTVREVLSATS